MSRRILHIFIIILLTRFSCYATHIVGGSLTYVYNGGSNYTITLKLYRDCGTGTANLPASVLISVLGNNGASFFPSKDITIPLGTVTNVPSNLSPCAIPPNPLPCVQEAVYTKTVNNLPSNFGGYHLYYQIVARNLTLTNVNAACSCIGESFYAHIPGTNETDIWNENFTLPNGTTSDIGLTAWSTSSGSVAPNSAMVNNNLFEIKGANNAKYTWTSQNINISSCTSVGVTVNLEESGTLDPNDSILVYYKLNGGAMTLFPVNGAKADDFTSTLASVTGLVGTNLEIIIRTRFDGNSPNSEIYKIDDIDVNCFSGPFITNSNPVFNSFPPLFICVNQPFTFNHSATDVDGDSLVYSFYTPYDGDNGVGPLDPIFPGNTASFTPITFLGGFSMTSPLGSPLSLNSSTGLLSGTPTIQGQFVVGVMVKEYRNGVYIGQTLRDFQFNVLSCPQPPPAITLNNISVNDGCSKPLIASGITSASATWNSISPGVPGAYNNYLSCTSGCLTPTVSAIGTAPPFVDYLVCGNSISCAGTFVCDTVRVTFNSTLGVNIQPSNPTLCFGQTSTTLTAVGTGGTPPYSYLWNNVNTSQNIFVGVGTYNVKITDGSGCPPAFNTIIVTSYSVPIKANAGPNKILCKQNPLATINATVSGAIGGIWSGGLGSFSPNNTTLSNLNYSPSASELAAGAATLFLTTTGNGNCPSDIDTLVIQYSNFTATTTTSVVNINCFGGTNGSSSILLTGGIGPFSYSWSTVPAQTANPATNLSQGTYSVTVIDGIGCTQVSTVIITQPPLLNVSAGVTNVSCNGGNNGGITTTVSGGTSPYTYLWLNTGQTISGISNLSAGVYSLQVTDAKGCVTTQTTIVTEPTLLNVSLTGTNISCFNGNTGSISSIVSGGTSGYTYSWSPGGSTGSVITNIVSGTYTLIVTDSKGCIKSQTTTLTQPSALMAIPSVTNESCNYLNNGIASVTASGGTAGYTYQWLPGLQTTTSINNLASGFYTVNVTDSHGCVTATIATVLEPSTLSINLNNQINVSCFGGSNGSISSSGLGGTPNYSYSWLPGGSTNAVLSGVSAGIYSLTVTDAKSCQTQTTVIITQPPLLNVSAGVTNVSCNGGNNGGITTTVSGGTSPYTYLWLNTGQTISGISNLSAGVYSLQVTDAKGCVTTQTTIVTEPTLLNVSLTGTNISCFNGNTGSISSIVSGGTSGYTYSWSPGGSTGSVITNIVSGTYTLIVTDSKGCIKSQTTTLTQPSALMAIPSVTNESCNYLNNGITSVTASGGTAGYTYQWLPGLQTTTSINNLASGFYTVNVTDSHGCVTTTIATVSEPSTLSINLNNQINVSCFGGSNGSISSSGLGGTPNYSYSWLPGGSTNAVLSGVQAGTYSLTVTDAKSCQTQTTVIITQPPLLNVSAGVTNVSCNGGNNGIISINPSGGTNPYSHTLFPGNIVSSNFASLSPGNYTVVTFDLNNCLNTTTVNISQPTTISSVVSQTNSNCGLQNGAASISITSGGLPPFTYQWLPSGGTASVTTNLFAGSYSVSVFDGNGCPTSNIVNINDIEGPVVSIASTTNVSCYGGSNGSAIATFSSGTSPFTYSWIPSGGNALVANSLSIGTYVIKVIDNLGCVGLATTPMITQPLPITTILSHTNVSCFGGSNGIASVVASAGTPGYSYSWTPGGNTSTSITGLTSGTYTVQVKDSYSCTSTNTIAVTQPTSSISLSMVSTSVSCFGGTNGSVIATANGGTMPYSYLWNGVGVSGNILSNITAGTYTVTGTDFNGCSITNTVAVIEPPVISLLMSSVNSNCSNASGQVLVSVTGGVGSYTYQWSPSGGTNSTALSLLSGNYSVTVQDANGCSASNSISVLNNPAPTVNISGVSDVSCYGGSNGTATVNVVGGSGPFTYSWSPLGGNGNIGANLSVGIYTVQVFSSNGCTVQATTPMIAQPLPITTILSHTNVSCFGGSNGIASVVASAGTPGYSYSWTPGGNTSTSITGLTSGTYTIQVKDSYSCTSTNTIAVTQPTLISVNISSLTNVSCFGGNNGNATINVFGGTSPFSYNWLPYGGNGSTGSGLVNGTYTVNITDVNSCATSTIISITQPSMALSASVNSTGASCFGGTDGAASVTVTGGTSNYTYQWSPNGGNLSTANSLSAGNYLVTISDANNCQLTTQISVNQPSILTSTLVIDDATCGLSNGSIISQINGGISPYSYSWNAGVYSTSNLINIPANSYSLNITDANNCLMTYSAIVNNLTGPSMGIVSTTSVLCNGGNNATATATISNAALPYSFNWIPNGSNSLIATNLTAGSYTAQLIDAKGCTVTANTNINEPLPLSITSASVTNVLCFGQNNGSVNISVTGGSAIYSYSWSPNVSSSSIASNLTSGNYTVFVKDNNSCFTSLSMIVNEPSLLTSNILNTVNPICYNITGASSVNVSGGTMPYVYNWSTIPVQTGSNAWNLHAGNYTVSIFDANGCSISNTLSIIEPAQIITSLSVGDTICIGQQTNIIAGAIGGAGNYYYTWQPSGIINSGTLSVSPIVNTTYTVVAFDQNGCAGIEDSVNVVVYDLTSSNVQVTGQTPICFGQASMIEGQINGNTGPVNVSWNNGLGNTIGPFIEQPINPITYVMTVTNACGLSVSDSVSITFNPPPVINIISDTIKGCAPSSINFSDSSVTGNTLDPITSWSWDFGDGTISTSQNPSHIFNNAGTYTVNLTVITDAGCTANSSSNPIIINAYSAPVANFSTNMIDFDIPYDILHCTNLSNGGIDYEWSFGDGAFSNIVSPSYLYNSIGQYQIQLVVSNQHGCKDTAVAEIVTHSDVIFPNAFTPNPDGSTGGSYTISSLDNDVFFPYTSGVIDFKLQIYDRWGELIFESTDVKTGWDGYYRGKLCQMGVYVWKAYVKLNDNRIFKKTGDVTLLR